MTAKESGEKSIALNKKARHLYEFLEKYEAGMVLVGSEVKSLRAGRISFKDGYVKFTDGEAFLVGVHIAPYENAGVDGHDPERLRKLLLHAGEIHNLRTKVEQKGLTVVPVRVYFQKRQGQGGNRPGPGQKGLRPPRRPQIPGPRPRRGPGTGPALGPVHTYG